MKSGVLHKKYDGLMNCGRRWVRSGRGSIAVYMAILLPVLITSIGLSIDLSQAYLIRERLGRAVDAAALAVAGSTFEGNSEQQAQKMQKRVDDFMAANYPSSRAGGNFKVNVVADGDDITVTATTDYDTLFMSVVGVSVIGVDARATVRKQVKGVEAVLVLDNTGSMDYQPSRNGPTNIAALRTAANDFVNIMFDKATSANEVRIGLVPYANSVRVGRYGLGLNPDGTPYLDREGNRVSNFVNLPSGMNYTNDSSSSTGWFGCVVEQNNAKHYSASANHVSGSYGQLWSTASGSNSTKCSDAGTCRGHGWDPASSSNDPWPSEITPDSSRLWDPYMFGRVIAKNNRCSSLGNGFSNGSTSCSNCTGTYNNTSSVCADAYCYCKYSQPSNSCPRSNILPLTSDRQTLLNSIATMQAHGNTQGNAGMVWGSHLISPEAPFTEASPWNNDYWSKAVVMMTDGDNTMDGSYSYYWESTKNNISVSRASSPLGLNQRFKGVCDYLKSQNPPVLIYTIVFKSQTAVSAANKQFYKDCATSSATYFEAPTQESLQQVFQQIARELSNLHIKE